LRVFLIRGVIAVAWAVVFTAVANSLTTSVTVVAGVLLVLYGCSPGTVNPITRREDFVDVIQIPSAGTLWDVDRLLRSVYDTFPEGVATADLTEPTGLLESLPSRSIG
jgi:hypothetical protein